MAALVLNVASSIAELDSTREVCENQFLIFFKKVLSRINISKSKFDVPLLLNNKAWFQLITATCSKSIIKKLKLEFYFYPFWHKFRHARQF